MLITALTMICAVLLDRLFGEPRRFHPLAAFGHYANWLERRINAGSARRLRGLSAWVLALSPCWLLAFLWWELPALRFFLDVLILYFALGMQSLREHAQRVRLALQSGDLALARLRVSEIVSRDTAAMQQQDVACAGVESVLENGNDAIFAALFWFAVAGAPGVLLYRLSNTLDAMWGYRNERYNYFGWAAARLDDVLNYLPARLTALSYALLGHTRSALRCWRLQAPAWDSPNAGPVMAAGAGALQVQMGGTAIYHGHVEKRPPLGCGKTAAAADITRAMQLVRRTLYVWLIAITFGALLQAGWGAHA